MGRSRQYSVAGRKGSSGSVEEPRSQHFLRSPGLVRRLVGEMKVAPGTLVLDIGAGTGAITQALAERGCRVVAVEKDARLYRSLRSRFVGRTNVECQHADALTFALPREPYVAVSNVPFSITAALVRRLLDAPRAPESAWLIVQREAALKFAGVPHETMFSLLRKPLFTIDVARRLPREAFAPVPPVDVALLHVRSRAELLLPRRSMEAWRQFVRQGFRSGAGDVRTAMRPCFTWRQLVLLSRDLRFDLRAPPSALTFGQWLAMFRFHAQACRGPTRAILACSVTSTARSFQGGGAHYDRHHVSRGRRRNARQQRSPTCENSRTISSPRGCVSRGARRSWCPLPPDMPRATRGA
jgi:23S rRNA (adenine-N6)-dimethyltransferase